MGAGHDKISGAPAWMVFALSRLFSWPALFGPVQAIHKLCWHLMNRTSAGYLPVTHTGERRVLTDVLAATPSNRPVVVFDCGANLGDYSLLVLAEARRAGRDVSLQLFEPSNETFQALTQRMAAHHSVARAHCLAVSETSGRLPIYFAWPGAGGTSLSAATSWVQGTGTLPLSSADVDAVSLDDFCEREGITHIDLLKMDIEGAELLGLQGARRLIERGAIGAVQFELGSAALPFGVSLYQFWVRYADQFEFFVVLAHGSKRIDAYSPDLECFFGASTFVMRRRTACASASSVGASS